MAIAEDTGTHQRDIFALWYGVFILVDNPGDSSLCGCRLERERGGEGSRKCQPGAHVQVQRDNHSKRLLWNPPGRGRNPPADGGSSEGFAFHSERASVDGIAEASTGCRVDLRDKQSFSVSETFGNILAYTPKRIKPSAGGSFASQLWYCDHLDCCCHSKCSSSETKTRPDGHNVSDFIERRVALAGATLR